MRDQPDSLPRNADGNGAACRMCQRLGHIGVRRALFLALSHAYQKG